MNSTINDIILYLLLLKIVVNSHKLLAPGIKGMLRPQGNWSLVARLKEGKFGIYGGIGLHDIEPGNLALRLKREPAPLDN